MYDTLWIAMVFLFIYTYTIYIYIYIHTHIAFSAESAEVVEYGDCIYGEE